jgi:hypothetical protein
MDSEIILILPFRHIDGTNELFMRRLGRDAVGEYGAARAVSISLSPGTGKSHLRDCPTEPSARDKSCLRINTLPGDAGSKQASAAVCAGARDGTTVLISGRNGDRRFLSQSAEQFAMELVAQVRKRYGRLRSLPGEKLLVWTAREATKFLRKRTFAALAPHNRLFRVHGKAA